MSECELKRCFAYSDGDCACLTSPITYKRCPFFKTKEQVEEEKEASLIRLKRRYRMR